MSAAVYVVLRHHADATAIAAVFANRCDAVVFLRGETIGAAMKFTGVIERPAFEDAEYWTSENDERTRGWSIEIQKHEVKS